MKKPSTKPQAQNKTDETAEILYQRIGNRWYAFSVINDDVFVGSVEDEVLDFTLDPHELENPKNDIDKSS